MLKAIEIENFKAFGDRTRIELAPITLIYGQNSAGKSSILQVLNLLKQTHESRESGAPLLPRAEAGIVDLGSFREMLFDHDAARTLRIGIEVTADGERMPRGMWDRFMGHSQPEALGIQLSFGLARNSQEVGLNEFSVAVGSLTSRFASFETRPLTDKEAREMFRMPWNVTRRRSAGRRQHAVAAVCEWVATSPDVWDPVHRAWLNKRAEIHKLLSQRPADEMIHFWQFARETLSDEAMSERDRDLQGAFAKAKDFYSQPFSLESFIDRMSQGWRGTLLGLDGFVPIGGIGRGHEWLPELELAQMRHRKPLSLPMKDVAGIATLGGRLLEDALESLFPMGPFRRPPERWYIFTGTSPKDVGYKGDHLPDLLFRRPELVDHANRWLKKLDIGYRLHVRPIGADYSDLFEVRLVDTRRNGEVEVGLSDVGFGISQILPFLVQSLASTNQIISIEQPEVHIHPRLQADLGELLAECVGKTFNHQFLIETHSEHLVLRLQKLIRAQRLKPTDVSIVFVERGHSGSRVKRLHLNERGEFVDEWPGGFFPERLRELA
jgi:energy-coupling factor transporter ATP-binding protein EcfA2